MNRNILDMIFAMDLVDVLSNNEVGLPANRLFTLTLLDRHLTRS